MGGIAVSYTVHSFEFSIRTYVRRYRRVKAELCYAREYVTNDSTDGHERGNCGELVSRGS